MENMQFHLRDLQLNLNRQHAIQFANCLVGGHNAQWALPMGMWRELSVQESFMEAGLEKQRFHTTALQTLAKLIENSYNSLPLGNHQHERARGTPVLKMICPNHLRVGRLNNRDMDGLMRLPRNREEQLKEVSDMYTAWFKIWQDVYCVCAPASVQPQMVPL